MIQTTHITPADIRSLTFERLAIDMQTRLDELRKENDSFGDHETTTKRRGRIAELKEWLALATQAQSREAGPFGPASFQPPGET